MAVGPWLDLWSSAHGGALGVHGGSVAVGGLHGRGSMVGSLVFILWWGSVGPWWVCGCWASPWLWVHDLHSVHGGVWMWVHGSLAVGGLHGRGSMVGSMVFGSWWCICVGLWTLGVSMAVGPWLDLWSLAHGGALGVHGGSVAVGGLHGHGSGVGSMVFTSWWGLAVGPWFTGCWGSPWLWVQSWIHDLQLLVRFGCGSMVGLWPWVRVGSMVFSSWCICVGLWQLGVSMAMGDLHGSGPVVGSRVFSSRWGSVGQWWVCGCWGVSMAVGPWLDLWSSAHGGALWVHGVL